MLGFWSLLLGEQSDGLIGLRRVPAWSTLAGHLQQQGQGLGVVLRAALEQGPGQVQPAGGVELAGGRRPGWIAGAAAQAGQGPIAIAELGDPCGEARPLRRRRSERAGSAGLPQPLRGPWPAGPPAGQVQGAGQPVRGGGARLQGGSQGGGMGREALHQLGPQGRAPPAEGVEGIRRGGGPAEPLQQRLPQLEGSVVFPQGGGVQGGVLEGHRRHRIGAPPQAAQQSPLQPSVAWGPLG